MKTYEKTQPLWRVIRMSYNGETITEVACPACGEDIPRHATRAGVPGGMFSCTECGKHFTLPPPKRIQRVDRPKVYTRGIECDLEAIVAAAQRAAFSAGWTRDEWSRTEIDLMQEPMEEFERRLASWFDVIAE